MIFGQPIGFLLIQHNCNNRQNDFQAAVTFFSSHRGIEQHVSGALPTDTNRVKLGFDLSVMPHLLFSLSSQNVTAKVVSFVCVMRYETETMTYRQELTASVRMFFRENASPGATAMQ